MFIFKTQLALILYLPGNKYDIQSGRTPQLLPLIQIWSFLLQNKNMATATVWCWTHKSLDDITVD